jgi:glycosyltransferase involved in cell wall biosynthesis
MSAGLPVIASDFPLWRDIIYQVGCGVCVDPLSPDAIVSAISELLQDPVHLENMGRNGRRAIEQIYNWEVEQNTLISLYDSLETGRRV